MNFLRSFSLSRLVVPPSVPRLALGFALAASLCFPSRLARAEPVVGVSGGTAFPSSRTSGVERDSAKVGAGLGLTVGHQFDLGPVALRPEGVLDYTRMPAKVLRVMAGGRIQGTGIVVPFAIARAGWGMGSFESRSTGLAPNQDGFVYAISRNGFAYELGAGLGLRPSGPLEVELLVAYNGVSEPVVEDVPLLRAHWLSAGLGVTYHF
jgi:hypothetical protein